jgi:peptidyl-prolyl cis-trans isomerase B (cyclophilin B)
LYLISEEKLASKKTKGIDSQVAESLKRYEAKQNVTDHRISVRAKDNRLAIIITAAVFVFALVSQYTYFNYGPGVSPTACVHLTQSKLPQVGGAPNPIQIPDAGLSQCRDWHGDLVINKADLKITLHGNVAPQAVANFVTLANNGFYAAGQKCHRLVTSGIYVLQCGDPKEDGTGGPGYSFGPIENSPTAPAGVVPTYKKGWLAMARSGNNAESMGSQFFIVYKDSQIPNDSKGGYTVFGEVTSGLDGLNSVFNGGVVGGKSDGKPKVTAAITKVTVK